MTVTPLGLALVLFGAMTLVGLVLLVAFGVTWNRPRPQRKWLTAIRNGWTNVRRKLYRVNLLDYLAGCSGKVRYGHEATAQRACVAMEKSGKTSGLHPYECRYCGAYHVGHKREGGKHFISISWSK